MDSSDSASVRSSGAVSPPAGESQQLALPPANCNLQRPCNEGTQNNLVDDEPKTIGAQERAAPPATSTAQALVSLPAAEKEPIMEGLEDYSEVKAADTHGFPRYVSSATFQKRGAFLSNPAEATRAQAASSSAAAAVPAPLASAPAAYPHLKEHTDDNNKQPSIHQEAEKPRQPEIPTGLLFAAAGQLYHSAFTNPPLRIFAAAHFLHLALQSNPEDVASWEDCVAWGAMYGLKEPDLRAAVGLVGSNDGQIILDPPYDKNF